ncbi:hypothetical protein Sjap_005931 [Stephania japonica]|uniref:GTP cyclohydrolase 1 n=1 Tax=Stephania japonica TaxID=461633 RepID=A0AAP0K6H7_9MAGN
MGALDEGHFNGELENGVKLINLEVCDEEEVEATAAIEGAVKVLLQGLGEDVNREGLKKTPLRVAKALREGTKGYRQKAKDIVQSALFPEAGLDSGVGYAGGTGGLVIVRDIDLFSYCESCLFPFQVKCHVGYIPSGQRVVGLSKLSRVAEVFARRLQEPRRLGEEICSALDSGIKPAGVAVVLQCWHIQFPDADRNCFSQIHHPSEMGMQGWSKVSVRSGLGLFENEGREAWGDFLALLKFRGVNVEKNHAKYSTSHHWCPFRSLDAPSCNGHASTNIPLNGRTPLRAGPSPPAMVAAVAMILNSLGEDPSRKEFVSTPRHFVQWLMKFRRPNMDMQLNGFDFDQFKPRLQKNKNDVDNSILDQGELQTELNIPFWSLCEHHLLPFHGVIHIGYFQAKGAECVERSRLQSIAHFHGWKLQVQERLSRQIMETVAMIFGDDVMVVVEASHTCMISRGIEKVGTSTATIATMGRFSTDPTAKAMFLQTVSDCTASGG